MTVRHRRTWGRAAVLTTALFVLALLPALASAQPQGMDLSQASGVPLPASDLPAGTVTVRVVRQSFANNVAGVDVTFTVDGTRSTVTTDAEGRAELTGLAPGTRVQAAVSLDGEELTTQETVVGAAGGVRFILVGGLGAGAAPATDPGLPPMPGTVGFGGDARIVADFSDERLNVYYVLPIVNPSASPVDPGGPLILELPQGARGATVLESSTARATAIGARVTVQGPFPPGTSSVELAYELPFGGDSARLEQVWPADLGQLTFFLLQQDQFDLESAQFSSKQSSVERGQPLVVGVVPSIPEGQALVVDITGLPHHPVWPRNTALALGGALALLGLWAAFGPGRARQAA